MAMEITQQRAQQFDKLEETSIKLLQQYLDGQREGGDDIVTARCILNVIKGNRQTTTAREALRYNMIYDLNDPKVLNKYVTNAFVATGCSEGDILQAGIDAGFAEVWGFELDRNRHEQLKRRFENRLCIYLYSGESPHQLNLWLPKFPKRAPGQPDKVYRITYWLNAHLRDGQQTIPRGNPCPVLKELDQIIAHRRGLEDIVLIDNLHLYRRGFYGITIHELIHSVSRLGECYRIYCQPGWRNGRSVPGDILVCEPAISR